MKVGSLFTGIAGFDLGFEQAGFETVWQVEKEPFCIAVLKTRFPNVERYYDITLCGQGQRHKLSAVDVVTAGFPCQDLSVAGKRAGLGGTRSGLFWEVVRIVGELRPRWLVLENVPGLFSSDEGRDFAIVLRELGKLGCFQSIAWTVLDSRYFGVAQRRRRVFIVCGAGIGSAEQVLFESESCERDFTESGEERSDVAFALAASVRGTGDGHGQAWNSNYVAEPITASYAKQADSSNRNAGPVNLYIGQRRGGFGDSIWTDGIAPSLQSEGFPHTGAPDKIPYVALAENQRHELRLSRIAPQLSCSGGKPGSGYAAALCAPADSNRVRDFAELPEGLDDSRRFPLLPEGQDSARYRALGNAVTVSVARWIAERIKAVNP